MVVAADGAAGDVDVVAARTWTSGEPCHGRSAWLAGAGLHHFHRRNCRLRPLVLADRALLHGPGRTLRPAASGVRVDFERVVPWRPRDSEIDYRWIARDLRRRGYADETGRAAVFNLEAGRCDFRVWHLAA